MADALQRPWLTALLLAGAATPPAVILAIPAPAPLDAMLAWPLVILDRWIGARGAPGPLGRVGAGLLGIALTWVHYLVVARLLVGWVGRRARDS